MSDPWAQFKDAEPQQSARLVQPGAHGVTAADVATTQPDKYKAAAQAEMERAKAAGMPWGSKGYLPDWIPDPGRGLANGALFGALPTLLATLETPIEMAKQGTWSPVEGYNFAKARQELTQQKYEHDNPVTNFVAGMVGGIRSGNALAEHGLTLVKEGQKFLPRVGAMATEGAGYGALTGFNSGDGLSDRASRALGGSIGGLAAGGVMGAGIGLVGKAGGAVGDIYKGRFAPEAAAGDRLEQALQRSGKSADQVVQALTDANAAGQGSYAVADALGRAGGESLSKVTRSPGPGQVAATEFLDNRQAGQGRRIVNQLTEGFDAPETAKQADATLRAARREAADANYGAARDSAQMVDAGPAVAAIDQQVAPGVRVPPSSSDIGSDTVTSVLGRARGMLTNGEEQLSNFNEALLVKRDLDAMIDRASPTQQRALIPVRNALDDQLAAASAPYAHARDTFSQQSKAIDAISTGREAARRGRTEDTIPAFNALPADQQATFRVGYADPLVEAVQGAAPGANKARPLVGDAHRDEISAFAAPGRADKLQDQLRREMEMFSTRERALGGSRTADNLANDHDFSVTPRAVFHLAHGNPLHMLGAVVRVSKDAMTGNTEAVRKELGDLLMRTGSAPDLAEILTRAQRNLEAGQRQSATLGRTAAIGAGEIAGSNQPRKRK